MAFPPQEGDSFDNDVVKGQKKQDSPYVCFQVVLFPTLYNSVYG